MDFNKEERYFSRKSFEKFFVKNPKIKKCDVVGHFVKEMLPVTRTTEKFTDDVRFSAKDIFPKEI